MNGRSPLRGSGHSPKGGAASSTASPAKPSVPNASEAFAADVAFIGATLDRLRVENGALKNQWRGMDSLPRDATVLVTVVPGPQHTFPAKIKPATHPAYIDEDGLICDPSSWLPDKGLHGTHWRSIAWMPMPEPASAIEARSDATGTGAAEGESAPRQGDAQ